VVGVVVHEVEPAFVLVDRLVVALAPQKVVAQFVALFLNGQILITDDITYSIKPAIR
jgi:hypothetical protein